jgi:hypothetical protein
MKRFLLFEGLEYYPSGGVYDFVASFNTLEEAQNQPNENIDWQNILDLETGKKYKKIPYSDIWTELLNL